MADGDKKPEPQLDVTMTDPGAAKKRERASESDLIGSELAHFLKI